MKKTAVSNLKSATAAQFLLAHPHQGKNAKEVDFQGAWNVQWLPGTEAATQIATTG